MTQVPKNNSTKDLNPKNNQQKLEVASTANPIKNGSNTERLSIPKILNESFQILKEDLNDQIFSYSYTVSSNLALDFESKVEKH